MKITAQKKLLIYKILLFVFALFVAFMPSTATRSAEVNSRVIVEILGIDGSDDGEKISVTAQYVMPTETQGATSKDTVTVEGETLTIAVEALNTALGRRAELGHCSMVVVGSSATPEHLGTLMTATDVTADVYLSAAEDKASDFISDVTEFMKKTGATDADFIAYSAKQAHVAINTLLGFLSDLGSASNSAYIPVVTMLEDQGGGKDKGGSGGEEQQSEDGGNQSDSGGSGGGGSDQKGMQVDKLALYNREGRVGVLDSFAARGVAWVSANAEKGIITADIDVDGKTVKDVSGRLLKKHASIKVNPENNSATVKLKAYVEPNGDKFNELGSDKRAEISKAIREAYAESIEDEIKKAYADSLELECDPLFLGREFYRHAPDYYADSYYIHNISLEYDIEVVLK